MSREAGLASRRSRGASSLPAGFLAGLALLGATSALGQSGSGTGPDTVRVPIAFAETPPLREIPVIQPLAPLTLDTRPELEMPPTVNGRGKPPSRALLSESSVLQSTMGPLLMPTPATNFLGVGAGLAGFTVGSVPPDTNGDVGPNHYVQWVNTSFAVFNKSTGAVLYGPTAGKTLFTSLGGGCATNNDGDPLVMYDSLADRWFMSQFSVSTTPYLQCVAVSKTPDPTGAWYTWAFSYGNTNFNDYGKSGVWPDGYYMMYHDFANGTTWAGTAVCTFDRVKMVSGDPTATQQCFGPNVNYGGLLPAHLNLSGSQLPPAGAPNYYMAMGASGQLLLWPFHVDWRTPANSTFPFSAPRAIVVAPFTELCSTTGTCVPQSGTTNTLDSLADRLMWRLNYRNIGGVESLVVDHSVVAGTSGGVRWYEIRSPGAASPTVFQQGTYAPDATYRWMGSVNMDRQGNMAVGYSASSSSTLPSIRYAGRLATDTLGALPQSEATLQAGAGFQTTYPRWGDYSSMSVDPGDGCTFWYTNEYLPGNGIFNWSTRIGSFKFPGCTSCNPTQPTATSNSPVCTGGTLTLSTPDVAGATYSWFGPNGFTSSLRSPTISSVTSAAAGLYSVLVTVGGCTSLAGTTSVVVTAIPATPAASNGGPYCVGGTIGLSTPTVAGATYGWTGPNGFTSPAQSPTLANATTAMAGTYSVTVTTGGCTSPAGTTSVVVTAVPATPAASNGGPYCVGGTIGLSTPTVAGATYRWTGPNGFTSAAQSPTLANATAAMAGTYSVTVTTGGCTSPAGTTSVVVTAVPATPAASNGGPYCVGGTISLSTPTVAGATYRWTGPNGFSSAAQSPTLANATAAMAGTYSVTVTTGGCTSPAGTTSVVVTAVPATPVATNTGPYCEGSAIGLAASTVAGATYAWTGPNGYTSSVQNPTLPGATTGMSGTYRVTATVGACASTAATTVVTVNPIPVTPTVSNSGPACEGASAQFSAPSVAGATYAWTGPNGYTSPAQLPTLANLTTSMAGDYVLTVTVGGCTSPQGRTTLVVNPKPATPVVTAPTQALSGVPGYVASIAAVPGSTCSWSITNGTITSGASTTSVTFTPGAPGVATLSATVRSGAGCASDAGTAAVAVAGGMGLYTVTPCRLADTRDITPPPVPAGGTRILNALGGACGIPAAAKAVALNVTVASPPADGFLALFPGDQSVPASSTINFRAGQVRANNAVVPLGADGTIGVFNAAAGPTQVILDVVGYFQ